MWARSKQLTFGFLILVSMACKSQTPASHVRDEGDEVQACGLHPDDSADNHEVPTDRDLFWCDTPVLTVENTEVHTEINSTSTELEKKTTLKNSAEGKPSAAAADTANPNSAPATKPSTDNTSSTPTTSDGNGLFLDAPPNAEIARLTALVEELTRSMQALQNRQAALDREIAGRTGQVGVNGICVGLNGPNIERCQPSTRNACPAQSTSSSPVRRIFYRYGSCGDFSTGANYETTRINRAGACIRVTVDGTRSLVSSCTDGFLVDCFRNDSDFDANLFRAGEFCSSYTQGAAVTLPAQSQPTANTEFSGLCSQAGTEQRPAILMRNDRSIFVCPCGTLGNLDRDAFIREGVNGCRRGRGASATNGSISGGGLFGDACRSVENAIYRNNVNGTPVCVCGNVERIQTNFDAYRCRQDIDRNGGGTGNFESDCRSILNAQFTRNTSGTPLCACGSLPANALTQAQFNQRGIAECRRLAALNPALNNSPEAISAFRTNCTGAGGRFIDNAPVEGGRSCQCATTQLSFAAFLLDQRDNNVNAFTDACRALIAQLGAQTQDTPSAIVRRPGSNQIIGNNTINNLNAQFRTRQCTCQIVMENGNRFCRVLKGNTWLASVVLQGNSSCGIATDQNDWCNQPSMQRLLLDRDQCQ